MHYPPPPKEKINSRSFDAFFDPVKSALPYVPELTSRGDRPLKLTFEDQLKALVYFHLQEHTSARHLTQDLNHNEFAKQCIAPDGGISRSSFSEAVNGRGLEQLEVVFQKLSKQAVKALPKEYAELGDLISIDGSLIDAVLSMYWADYAKGHKKAKGHFGFDINHGIPSKVFLTDGNGAERQFVCQILSKGQTGVMDRGYQCNELFDLLQLEGKSYICRIKEWTTRTIVSENIVEPGSYVFYDAVVLLGTKGTNQTEEPVRVVGYEVEGVKYFIATNRHDLTADQVATAYKLRWSIETFFQWWKKHVKVYHLIARSKYGLMVQILSGLITYLLMAIYCQSQFSEKVSIKRIRELRITILNELYGEKQVPPDEKNLKERKGLNAKT